MENEVNKEEILRDIETKYPVDQISVNGQPFWPFYRALIYSELLKSQIIIHAYNKADIFKKIRNGLFGLGRLFRRYDYIFFSNELERKNVDDIVIDKLAEKTIELLGYDKSLYVEQVWQGHLQRKEYGKKKVLSMDLLLILAAFFSIVFRFSKPRIAGREVLLKILSDYGLNVDINHRYSLFMAKVHAVKFLLRIHRPRMVFITDYGSYYITYAAHALGIPVAEYQHGIINISYYHPARKLDARFCPDYFFVFGESDRQQLLHGLYVSAENIFPVGSYYLQYLYDKPVNAAILQRMKGYAKSVCVPTNKNTQDYLLSFVRTVASRLPDVLFIFVPREKQLFGSDLPPNVMIETELSFQEVVRHCTFHSTTYSTCNLEALTLGTQNVVIDEDGLSSYYLGSLLNDTTFTRFCKNADEYVETIKSFQVQERAVVHASNRNNFAPDYVRNLQSALNKILHDHNN
ncbi:MAG: hypothetical protein DIU61_004700 [Bacteroidota bacterium]|jgi:hypothetical protein|nr:MAG: hypothetical protein DIU61_01905 [Bacteroidota bacterium]